MFFKSQSLGDPQGSEGPSHDPKRTGSKSINQAVENNKTIMKNWVPLSSDRDVKYALQIIFYDVVYT